MSFQQRQKLLLIRPSQEPGYTLEVFNAVGDTVVARQGVGSRQ